MCGHKKTGTLTGHFSPCKLFWYCKYTTLFLIWYSGSEIFSEKDKKNRPNLAIRTVCQLNFKFNLTSIKKMVL